MKNYPVSSNKHHLSRRRATKTEGFVYPSKAAIKPGSHVKVVQKQDQRTGKLTEGVVKNILTNFATHPHGIKVRLENGVVGRVKEVIDQS